MWSNPFTYGNPISDPRRFVGRAREVEQIFGRLRNKEFESSSVVGDHRIGKTSLLKYLAHPEVRRAHGLEPERYSFIYVDLQLVNDTMGPEQLWRRLLLHMRRQPPAAAVAAELEALERQDRLDTFDLDELFQVVDASDHFVVFLLDEFERVTTNANFGPDFYYGLRSLLIQHRIALVTSSRRELVELCHSDAIKSSPFFNVFANINLRLFSPVDFERLVSSSLGEGPVQFSPPEVEEVVDLAGLHPFFLQIACSMLYESYQADLGAVERKDFLAENFRSEALPHVVDYWNNSGDHEKIVLTAAALLEHRAEPGRGFTLPDLQRVFSRGEFFLERLEKRGLLMSGGGRYRLFSSVAGPWIIAQIAEVSEERSYPEWLAQNTAQVERVTGKQSGLLREILPRVGVRYRQLIITWASDPQTFVAMAGLLKSVLAMVG